MKTQVKCLSPQGGDRSGDRGGGVPEVRTIIYPDPCAAAGCAMQADPLDTCRDHRCPHRWQREAAEDRGSRDGRHVLSNPAGRHQNVEGGTPC